MSERVENTVDGCVRDAVGQCGRYYCRKEGAGHGCYEGNPIEVCGGVERRGAVGMGCVRGASVREEIS